MKLIELSKTGKKHKGKYFAMVDDEDYEELNKYNWFAKVNGNHVYASRRGGNGVPILMHREILGITKSEVLVDHRDMNGTNNQRSNLRTCNKSENARNSRPCGASKYLGVSIYAKARGEKVWKTTITINRKYTHIGYYSSEEEAARVYDEYAKRHHGEFANLNFK